MVVRKFVPTLRLDSIVLSIHFSHSFLGPKDLAGKDLVHGSLGKRLVAETSSHHGPAWLVVMVLGRLENPDVSGIDIGPHQVGTQIQTPCASTDDANFILR